VIVSIGPYLLEPIYKFETLTKPNLAIDFDGTIHDVNNPVKGRKMGPPILGSREALTQLQGRYRLVIHTVWGNKPGPIEDWLKYWEIPFDEVTNLKPQAEFYIDDKAIRFTDWASVLLSVVR
jgi:hypothetical protein